MQTSVLVLANAESITSYNQASGQDNFLNEGESLVSFTRENFDRILSENLKFRRKIEDLQDEVNQLHREELFDSPTKMVVN